MVVEKELKVSAEAFFNEITKSIVGDIRRQTGKKVHASQLKPGTNYKKKIPGRPSSNAEVRVKILACEPNILYSSSFTSSIDETITTYEISSLDTDRILVRYTEEYRLLRKISRLFDESRYMEKRSQKRGLKLLKKIEDTILNDQQESV